MTRRKVVLSFGLALTLLLSVLLVIWFVVINNQSVEREQLSGPYKMVDHTVEPAHEWMVPIKSNRELLIQGWLQKQLDRWQLTYVTYAPCKVLSGRHFELNFCPDNGRCVLNYQRASKDRIQLVKDVSPAEAAELDALFNAKD